MAGGLLVCSLTAVVLEAAGCGLPLGVVNQNAASWNVLALASGGVCLLLLGLLVWEIAQRRATVVGDALCSAVGAVVVMELLVRVVDVTLASRHSSGSFGGPYYEDQTRAGAPVILKKGGPAGLMGLRTAAPSGSDRDRPDVLFLGDSYTEGSGHSFACNYPQVAGEHLSAHFGRTFNVLNAGVAGYGPVEAANLFEYLLDAGIRPKAVVYSLFLENDFTDDLPGTERRVIAGMPFRLPRSGFLRTFHPLHLTRQLHTDVSERARSA